MHNLDPAVFGRAFGKLTAEYFSGIGIWLAPVFHVVTLALLVLAILYGNRFRTVFAISYLIDYLWIFVYVGLVMGIRFYEEMGIASLAFWGIVPILLGAILWQWFKEIGRPRLELAFSDIPRWRWVVLPIMAFGFWYPTFIWGHGFSLLTRDLLFSSYGLMPCPTTMMILGVLILHYPKTNTALFNALTLFAVWIGTAQFTIGYVPDYPLAIIGYFGLGMIVWHKARKNKPAAS